jgi:hypothetical protein
MAIKSSGSTGVEVPAGTQVSWRVREAAFEQDGKYGPTVELDLDVVTEEYAGAETKYWCRIQRPRIDKVAKLRGEGADDEMIEAILRKQNYEFENLDDPDEMLVSRAGALYSILMATQGGTQGAEQVLASCDTFDDLAFRLVGGRFVGTTRQSPDGYLRLDASEDIFVDKDPRAEHDRDLAALPYDDEEAPLPEYE